MKKFLSFLLFALCLTVAANAQSSCETPTNLTVSDITANSASLSWTGNVEEYEIEYGSGYYYYGFESGDLQGWTNLIVNTGEGEWLHSNDNPGDYDGSYDYTLYAHNGTGFVLCYSYTENDGAYNTDAYLVSPQKYQINNGASLSFWYDMANEGYPEYFEVSVATVDNPTADDFTSIWNLQDDGSKYYAWRDATIDLSAYAGQAIWIAFHDMNYDEYEIWIDDITVKAEAWTTVENATSPHTLNSLEAETPYFVHVRAICDDGVSAWTEPVEFTTEEETEEPCVINTIEITGFTEPVYGATPDYDVEVPGDANYTLNPDYMRWKNNTIISDMSSAETFGYGSYYMYFYVFTNEGCTFADEVSITINGDASAVFQTYFDEDLNSYYIQTNEYTLTNLCNTPTDLSVSAITTNSATVSWTGNQTGYNVLYGSDIIAYYADFEANRKGWTAIDADGDENSWDWVTLTHGSHSGDRAFRSMSVTYSNENLNPDNWLISPTLDLGGTMSVWLRSGDNDHFAIYLAPGGGSDVDDFTVTLVGETAGPDDWTEYTADLSPYAGQSGTIAIRHFNSGVEIEGYLDLDDFSVFEEQEPTLTATGNTIDLTGLEPGTTYKVLVQGICEDGVTEWTSPVEFTTEEPTDEPCVISEINIEGFTAPEWGEHPDNEMTVPEDANYTLGSAVWVSWDEANHQEEMMTREDVFDNEDVVYYMYFQITPKEGCTFVNPYYVTVTIDDNSEIVEGKNMDEGIFYAWTEEYTVTSPCVINTIEITGFTEPVYGATPDYDVEVPADANYTLGNVYWSENSIVMNTPVPFGANEYFMNIYIIPNEGCTFSDEVSVTINDNTEPVDPFSEVISDGSYHIYTIDYTLSAPSTCETPTNLSVSDITSNSATLSWTGNVEEYEIEYGRGGYYYYGFESGDLQGWTNLIVNEEGGYWYHSDDQVGGYDYSDNAHNGTQFVVCYSYIDYVGAFYTDAYLVSPQKYQINNGASLSFWYDMANDDYPEHFEISVATVDNPTADDFTSIWNLQDDGSKYNAWREATIDLSAFAGQAIWIAFHDMNYDEYEIWIDDITVKTEAWTTVENVTSPHTLNSLEAETPYFAHVRAICEDGVTVWSEPVEFTTEAETEEPCEAPTNLTATNITATSAKLGWTGNLEQYTVRYKEDAASDWTEATTTNRFFPLTGLTPATTYTAQVQGDCGSGAKSVTDWSEPVTFTTLSETVEPVECGPAEDCDGISYPTVKIGDVCWMTKNLAAETCVTTGNVYSYVNDQFPDEDANVETYGLLYDEEAAFATGICPEGYTLPTTEQFEYLKNNFTVEELRNGTGWIVNTGTNGTGFSWDGSGFRNGTSETFEHMLMEGYLWAVDMTSGTPQPAMYKMMYYCNEIVRVYDFNGISASIRCVKNAEPQPEPEPGTFNCGEGHPITIGSNSYETVQIGTQCWTKTNLRETKDKNGNDFIDGISAAAGSFDEYEDAVIYIPTEETWSEHNSSVTYDENTFGYYYNWTAANNVCPDGWHLPSDEEWTQLENYVSNAQEGTEYIYRCDQSDATSIAKALASETDVWSSYAGECCPGDQSVMPNNSTGFSAVPAGYWYGGFDGTGHGAGFWSSAEGGTDYAWRRGLSYGYAGLYSSKHRQSDGYSVRCLRD